MRCILFVGMLLLVCANAFAEMSRMERARAAVRLLSEFRLDGAVLSTDRRHPDQYNALIELRDPNGDRKPAIYLCSSIPGGGMRVGGEKSVVDAAWRSHRLMMKENRRHLVLGEQVGIRTDEDGRKRIDEPQVMMSIGRITLSEVTRKSDKDHRGRPRMNIVGTGTFEGRLVVGNREAELSGSLRIQPSVIEQGEIGVRLICESELDATRLGGSGSCTLTLTTLLVPDETGRSIAGGSGWTTWRGPNGDGSLDALPARLPPQVAFAWSVPCKDATMGGVSATDGIVVTTDRDDEAGLDIILCLDAATGRERWRHAYATTGRLDYGNGPRTTPVIAAGRIYVLGAFGHVHCLDAMDGRVHWATNLRSNAIGGRMPHWGYSAAPLLYGSSLIVAAGGIDSALVALDRETGAIGWRSGRNAFTYASPVLAAPNGVLQIIGRDSMGAVGYNPNNGERLWFKPLNERAVHVSPSPTMVGGRLLLSSVNDKTQLYGFDDDGRLHDEPEARLPSLNPNYNSPARCGDVILTGDGRGKMLVLDPEHGLEPVATLEDPAFRSFLCLFGAPGRALAVTGQSEKGVELVTLSVTADAIEITSRLKVFPEDEHQWGWAHPAVVGNRLYLRTNDSLHAVILADEDTAASPQANPKKAKACGPDCPTCDDE